MQLFHFLVFHLLLAPEDLAPPFVDGHNFTTMSLSWNPPAEQNGPAPAYTAVRAPAAFSWQPPRVERGARFPGGAYYRFPSATLPSSAYTGNRGKDLALHDCTVYLANTVHYITEWFNLYLHSTAFFLTKTWSYKEMLRMRFYQQK